jgi:hypothetical protein
VEGMDDIVLDREPVAVSEKGILREEDLLGQDGRNSRDDDASVLIIVFVSLTVILVVFGIVMLTCFITKRTKSATIHLKKEDGLGEEEPKRLEGEAKAQPQERTQDVGNDFTKPINILTFEERMDKNKSEIPLVIQSMSNDSPWTQVRKDPELILGPPKSLGESSSTVPLGPSLYPNPESSRVTGPKGPPLSLLSSEMSKALPKIKNKNESPDVPGIVQPE